MISFRINFPFIFQKPSGDNAKTSLTEFTDVASVDKEIKVQGDKVRQLKADKAPKVGSEDF